MRFYSKAKSFVLLKADIYSSSSKKSMRFSRDNWNTVKRIQQQQTIPDPSRGIQGLTCVQHTAYPTVGRATNANNSVSVNMSSTQLISLYAICPVMQKFLVHNVLCQGTQTIYSPTPSPFIYFELRSYQLHVLALILVLQVLLPPHWQFKKSHTLQRFSNSSSFPERSKRAVVVIADSFLRAMEEHICQPDMTSSESQHQLLPYAAHPYGINNTDSNDHCRPKVTTRNQSMGGKTCKCQFSLTRIIFQVKNRAGFWRWHWSAVVHCVAGKGLSPH